MSSSADTRLFAFVLIPSFSLLALASAMDGLRAANYAIGQTVYRWRVHAPQAGEITQHASCGMPVGCLGLDEAEDADVIVLCGGDQSHEFSNKKLSDFLRARLRRGASVGALSEASFILAEAGLFDGRRSTIHWKCQHAYRERFPNLDIRSSLFEIDGPVFSCVGGTSALDLILRMIMTDHGAHVASAVAENYHHDTIRGQEQAQKLSSILKYAGDSPALVNALFLMESNIETPLTVAELCRRSDIAHRRLDRLFQRYIGASPNVYYRKVRLERAAQLLSQTTMPIAAIATACGFASSSHLAKHFKMVYGSPPKNYRSSRQ
ncbi:MAG: GlxA family transcriptional regulator [Pseudomonadota bacterium]